MVGVRAFAAAMRMMVSMELHDAACRACALDTWMAARMSCSLARQGAALSGKRRFCREQWVKKTNLQGEDAQRQPGEGHGVPPAHGDAADALAVPLERVQAARRGPIKAAARACAHVPQPQRLVLSKNPSLSIAVPLVRVQAARRGPLAAAARARTHVPQPERLVLRT